MAGHPILEQIDFTAKLIGENATLRRINAKLLAACEAAYTYLDSVIEHQERMGKSVAEDTLEVSAQLINAIAKARGEQ